jgi:hypothetical protein
VIQGAILDVVPNKKIANVAVTVGALAAGLVLAGCTGANPGAESSASPPSGTATSSSPAAAGTTALTGFGATLSQWKAAHTLDVSASAQDAYLPHVAGSTDGEDTWQVVTVADGRVISYTLNVAPSSVRSAEARARQELPADARMLWTRTVAGSCVQEQFESATLAAALGNGQINVEFDNAISGNITPVTEELFSRYDAPTVARAPAC